MRDGSGQECCCTCYDSTHTPYNTYMHTCIRTCIRMYTPYLLNNMCMHTLCQTHAHVSHNYGPFSILLTPKLHHPYSHRLSIPISHPYSSHAHPYSSHSHHHSSHSPLTPHLHQHTSHSPSLLPLTPSLPTYTSTPPTHPHSLHNQLVSYVRRSTLHGNTIRAVSGFGERGEAKTPVSTIAKLPLVQSFDGAYTCCTSDLGH